MPAMSGILNQIIGYPLPNYPSNFPPPQAIASLPSDGPFQPSNELKLKMYGCYKQATVGPCNVPRPSFWDVVNKAKWDAWSALGQMDTEAAMRSYVEEIGKFVEMMPQNAAVRDLTEKLNVYEWVESSSTKSYGDSGVECNGNDEATTTTTTTAKVIPVKKTSKPNEGTGGSAMNGVASRVEKSAFSPLLNGRSDASSASDASSVKENPNYRRTDPDSTTEDSASDSPPPPSPLPPSLSSDTQNNNNVNGPSAANSISAGLIPRVNSFHGSSSPFNGSLIAGSATMMRGSAVNSETGDGERELRNGVDHDVEDDIVEDHNDLSNHHDEDRFEDTIVSEEVTRETLLLLKLAASNASSTQADDVASPVCPVYNSVVDSSSGKLPHHSDSEDDDEEYCDSSNDFSSHESTPVIDAVETTTTTTTTPLETTGASHIAPQSPRKSSLSTLPATTASDAASTLPSPHGSLSICSTDSSDLYATPAVVTPESEETPLEDDDDDNAEDAANILEREVKRLIETSVNQSEEITTRATELATRKVTAANHKEDLNYPLANEIRARPRHTTEKTISEETSVQKRETSAPKETSKPLPAASITAPAVRPKTTHSPPQKPATSPRPRRSGGGSNATLPASIAPENDEVRVLSDIEDVALRPSRDSFDQQRRIRQISIASRQEEGDSSSSESSHSSAWSPTGRSRRNFDDWPIRSGDDSFKTKAGHGGGRRHRDSDTTSAGGGGTGGGRGVGVTSNAGGGGATRGRGGQSASSSSRGRGIASNASSAGGAGGLPPPYPQQQPPIASAVNEQIAVALLRIQQDVSTLNARINTLETLFWSSRNGNGVPPSLSASAASMHSGGAHHHVSGDHGLTPPSPASAMKPIATTIFNWLFPGFSLRSVIFLLLWPVLAKGAYLIVKALIGLALMKRRRFIDGHDDLPPL